MRIINAGFEILDVVSGHELLQKIEKIGRLCYKSEDRITSDSCYDFVRGLINRKHEAMLEHVSISVIFDVDRGVTHEMVRHRLASFAQESTRYCNYNSGKFDNEITVINPQGAFWNGDDTELNNRKIAIFNRAVKQSEDNYNELIEFGAKPQEARSVLLTATKASIVITATVREWRHIMNLRAVGTTGAPHPQMLEVMKPLLDKFHSTMPVLFDDINY